MGLFLTLLLAAILSSCSSQTSDIRKVSYAYSHYMKGLLNDRAGSIEEAVSFYKQAQKIDEKAPALHEQAGLDYIRLEDFKKAVFEFEKAVALAPENEYTRYVLALLYIQLNDFSKAASQYTWLLEKNIGNRAQEIGLRRILSQLYFLDKDFKLARSQCNEILDLSPVDEWAMYMNAIIDSEEGHPEEAIQGFKQVLLYYPDSSQAMNSLAYTYSQQEIELDSALTLIDKALEYEPDNAAYIDTAGWIYFKLGDAERAFEYIQRASKLMFDPVILQHLREIEKYLKKSKKGH